MKKRDSWLYYWQDEVDAAFLYTKLAERIDDQEKKIRYHKLAAVEKKHVAAWENLLREQGYRFRESDHRQKHVSNFGSPLILAWDFLSR